MTESTSTTTEAAPAKKRSGGLNSMLLADLKSMAGGMGIAGAGSMKKAQLVEAIKTAQSGGGSGGRSTAESTAESTARSGTKKADKTAEKSAEQAVEQGPANGAENADSGAEVRVTTRTRSGVRAGAGSSGTARRTPTDSTDAAGDSQTDPGADTRAGSDQSDDKPRQRSRNRNRQSGAQDGVEQAKGEAKGEQERPGQGANAKADRQQSGNQGQSQSQSQSADQGEGDDDLDGEGGSRRNRRRRGRDRQVTRQGTRGEPDTTVLDDDVLVPAAGILDVLDNYAFVRTSGYLPGADDVYLSLSLVRRFGLRRGDAVFGQVRQPREGERKEKFNPMVRIDSVNGADPESSRERPVFESFVPVHPTERLRLETDSENMYGRLIDIAAPIGKGQRGLVLAPPASGRTTLLARIADSISANNPECHLMVVLLDARPEEVTDFQRAVKGEVIASTFDRAPSDHIMVAELSIERAKRLVELGHDVVVLMDSLTALGRAYNLAASAGGRTLAGGLDAGAVQPPKQVFGAARSVEGAGSLTVLATISIETGSPTDEAILDEFRSAANMELRMSRELVLDRVFPAIDVRESGTRHEDRVTSEREAAVTTELRRSLSGPGAVKDLLDRLAAARTNLEFLSKLESRR